MFAVSQPVSQSVFLLICLSMVGLELFIASSNLQSMHIYWYTSRCQLKDVSCVDD